jgi:hypothetical protein
MFVFIRLIRLTVVAAVVIWFCCPAQTVFARNQVITHVQVIQASTQSRSIDPALQRIVPELEKVFRYTGYTLLQDKTLSLAFEQPGRIDLPDRRTLVLTPASSQGGRIQYDIQILNRNEAVFQTRVLLKNKRSMTIGGPRSDHGVLLFHITGSLP